MAGCSMVLFGGIFAIFAVAFLAVMFVAIFTFILALTLLIIGIVKKKNGKKSGKVLIIISSIMLTIWFTIAGLFIAWNIYSKNMVSKELERTDAVENLEEVLDNSSVDRFN